MRKADVHNGFYRFSLVCDVCGGGSKPTHAHLYDSELSQRNAEALSLSLPVTEAGWAVERHPHPECASYFATAHLCSDHRTPRGVPVAARSGKPCGCRGCEATRRKAVEDALQSVEF